MSLLLRIRVRERELLILLILMKKFFIELIQIVVWQFLEKMNNKHLLSLIVSLDMNVAVEADTALWRIFVRVILCWFWLNKMDNTQLS